jgi:hypothetical protein
MIRIVFYRCAVIAAGLALGACGESDAELEATYTYAATAAVCPAGDAGEEPIRRAPEIAVFPDVQAIGTAANEIARGAGYLWVVESTSNTVSRFEPQSGEFDAYFIDVGDGRNPYDVAIDEKYGRAYITNWLANTVSAADLETGEVIAEVGVDAEVFDAPQGIALTGERIYVANSGYRGPGDYGPGSVTVLARDSLDVLARVETAHLNTAFVEAISTPEGPGVIVVNSGALEVTNDGAFVRSAGSVEIWIESDDAGRPEREVYPIELSDDPRMGAPGQPVLAADGHTVYLPSGTAPAIFKFDLDARRWLRGTLDPIVLHETRGDGAHNATIGPRGILYVSALNEDALYLVDTRCDEVLAGPIRLGTTDSQLEGPQDLEVVETGAGAQLFFVMTLSNAMGKVELDFAF